MTNTCFVCLRIQHLTLFVILQIFQFSIVTVANANEINIQGFLTAAGGKLSNNSAKLKGYEKDVSFGPDNILGLQVTSKISEDYRITTQLVVTGDDADNVRMDWGYLSNDVSDDFVLRLGRLRMPLFVYSESLEVGYAYPWISPPAEVYALIPFNSFNGAQGYYKQPWQDWEISFLGYVGSTTETTSIGGNDTKFSLNNSTGLGVIFDRDWLTMQFGYHQSMVTLSSSEINTLLVGLNTAFPTVAADLAVDGKKARYYQFGLQLNLNDFVVISEVTKIEVERSFIPSYKSWYGLFGYQIRSNVLLHLTYAEVEAGLETNFVDSIPAGVDANLDALRSGVNTILLALDAKQQSTVLGVRYDHVAGVAYKVEWHRIRVFAGRDSSYGKGDISDDGYTYAFMFAADVIF